MFLLGVLSGGDGETGNGRKGLVHIALKWAFSGKSIDFFRWQSSHLPLEGLCSRQQETQNDPLGRRVHPAILVARPAEGVRPDSPFWIHGESSAVRIVGTLPPTIGHGSHRSLFGNHIHHFRSLVSGLSWANHCHRKTEPGSTSMEICLENQCGSASLFQLIS